MGLCMPPLAACHIVIHYCHVLCCIGLAKYIFFFFFFYKLYLKNGYNAAFLIGRITSLARPFVCLSVSYGLLA